MKATISLDGQPFSGVDIHATWPTKPEMSRGWHNYPHGGQDVLTFGGEPHVIESARTLSGYVKLIIDAINDGLVDGHTVTIEVLR